MALFCSKYVSALLHGITCDFHCLNCFHSFRTENNSKVCKNKDFCGTAMPSEKNYVLTFKEYMKSDKMSYIIYADI